MSETCNFKEPGTLKEILEELGKLDYATDTRHKVFEQLKNGLKAYCGNKYLNAFYGDYGSGYGVSSSSGSIKLLTKAGHDICETILQKPSWSRSSDRDHRGHKDCGEKYFNALKECLPKTFAALYFLLFMGDKSLDKTLQGGQWKDYACDGLTYDYGRGSKVDFKNWLNDVNGQNTGLVKRGFHYSESLTNKKGSDVAEEIKKIIKHDSAAALQKVLCGFMFVCDWDDALTGHACLFLHKFCDEVGKDSGDKFKEEFEEKYSGKKYEELKELCRTLKSQLDSLVNGTSGLYAVCQKNTDLFKDLWDNGKFSDYCTWLKGNLHHIIEALEKMPMESSQWSSNHLMSATSAGPFKYGFVFTRKWDGESESLRDKVKGYISALINGDKGSLEDLKKCLNGDSSANSEAITTESTQSSSGAAAAGGATAVLGIG
ncbi:putative RIBOSOME BINDING PROTEIN-1, partial [Babesia divergens]